MTRQSALIELLGYPDPPEERTRFGHKQTQAGKADRFLQIPKNAAAFISWHQTQNEERAA